MFPLLDQGAPNPLELFQIWLNLPAHSKMATPHFTMFWSQDIPRLRALDAAGRSTEVAVIAGRLGNTFGPAGVADVNKALAPPPASWAAQAESDVAICTIRMAPGARWTLPAAAQEGTRRMLYFFKGGQVSIAGQTVRSPVAIELRADAAVALMNSDTGDTGNRGGEAAEFLLLQGRPIGESVAQYGPFVMNTQAEISQALADYQRTRFGGWPWPDDAPVHGRDPARFARHPDGREERPAD
jgi:redox-sensitive bicupin YhaK (pirin superfamily)